MPLYFWDEERKRRRSAPAQPQNYDPKNFLDKVPEKDSSGVTLPPWKRLIIARQMAEKSQKEDEERRKKEEEEARFKNMPAWKRALVERKEAELSESTMSLSTGFDGCDELVQLQIQPWAGKQNETVYEQPVSKPKRLAPPPPTHDEDGLPLMPWQVELQLRKTRAQIEELEAKGKFK